MVYAVAARVHCVVQLGRCRQSLGTQRCRDYVTVVAYSGCQCLWHTRKSSGVQRYQLDSPQYTIESYYLRLKSHRLLVVVDIYLRHVCTSLCLFDLQIAIWMTLMTRRRMTGAHRRRSRSGVKVTSSRSYTNHSWLSSGARSCTMTSWWPAARTMALCTSGVLCGWDLSSKLCPECIVICGLISVCDWSRFGFCHKNAYSKVISVLKCILKSTFLFITWCL